jgi:hypothetical protein
MICAGCFPPPVEGIHTDMIILKASRSRPVSRVGGRAVENERSASALRAHTSLREAGQDHFTSEAGAKPREARP